MAATTTLPAPVSVETEVHARRWRTLAVLALSLVIVGLDNTILNVALPTLQEEFSASPSQLQWMVDSYLLVFAGLLLVFGTLGDRSAASSPCRAGSRSSGSPAWERWWSTPGPASSSSGPAWASARR